MKENFHENENTKNSLWLAVMTNNQIHVLIDFKNKLCGQLFLVYTAWAQMWEILQPGFLKESPPFYHGVMWKNQQNNWDG